MGLSFFNRKKIAVIALVSGFSVITLLFQNCSKSAIGINALENSGIATSLKNSNGNTNASTESINLRNENIQSVDLLVQGSQTVEQNGRTFSVKSNDRIKVDLQSGQILLESEIGSNAVHCLSAELKSELVDILKSSKICKVQAAAGNNVCTQSVERSYAEIHTSRDDLKLGNNEDKCAAQYIDLCDEQSKMLRGVAQAIKNKIASLNCN